MQLCASATLLGNTVASQDSNLSYLQVNGGWPLSTCPTMTNLWTMDLCRLHALVLPCSRIPAGQGPHSITDDDMYHVQASMLFFLSSSSGNMQDSHSAGVLHTVDARLLHHAQTAHGLQTMAHRRLLMLLDACTGLEY
jgi:hypothetical protein